MLTLLATLALTRLVALTSTPAGADDVFYRVPVAELAGESLQQAEPAGRARLRQIDAVFPYAVLDGPGEAYVTSPEATSGFDRSWTYRFAAREAILTAKAPEGGAVAGWLFVPSDDQTHLVRVPFALKPEHRAEGAEASFHRAKAIHYEYLQSLGAPGGAYFRRQADLARRQLPSSAAGTQDRAGRDQRPEMGDTYDLFTGGRALSENLQLHRELPGARPTDPPSDEEMVPIGAIEGVTIASIDWAARIAGKTPRLDALARAIPADQHAVFFPSFAAVMNVLDEVAGSGLPLFRAVQPRSEDGGIIARYERQLCLPRSALARLLGPGVIKSVAITGSDPYFPTGTDVAVLFEAVDVRALNALLASQSRLAVAGTGAKAILNEQVWGWVSDDRSICCYVATFGGTVVVTNSPAQLKALGAVASGSSPDLASLPEYQFFRERYTMGDPAETGLLFLSDATIRRWCGPKWRIAASRRLRAAAIMADVTAEHAEALISGVSASRTVTADTPMRTIGTLMLGPRGVFSSVYGHFSFLTPIAELEITDVPKDESTAYKRWRDTYQRNWSWAFDPIALRFGFQPDRVSADLTVMPLIAGSEYRLWMSLAEGAKLAPGSGDPHDAIAHGVIALNPESAAVRQAGGFGRMMAPNLEMEPFAWLGGALAIYADPDPFWNEMLGADEPEAFLQEIHRLPVGLYVEVTSALKLTAFLTAVRSFIEQSSPGMTAWETRAYNDQPYVRVGMSEKAAAESRDQGFDKVSVFYAATPRALIVSLNEDVLKRAIDRQAARVKTDGQGAPGTGDWLGSSLGLRFTQEGIALIQGPGRQGYREAMQNRAWLSLPILNEWKRRFPDQDPVAVHERLWGARLICPGGGGYVWDQDLRSVASTVFGHPAAPKAGPDGIGPLGTIRVGNLGLSFEGDGLRAKAVIEREGR